MAMGGRRRFVSPGAERQEAGASSFTSASTTTHHPRLHARGGEPLSCYRGASPGRWGALLRVGKGGGGRLIAFVRRGTRSAAEPPASPPGRRKNYSRVQRINVVNCWPTSANSSVSNFLRPAASANLIP